MTCSICRSEFDLELEGGTEGSIGIIPASFCPTCLTGIMELADILRPYIECPECGKVYEAVSGE